MEKFRNLTLRWGILVTILALAFGLFCTGRVHDSSMRQINADNTSTMISGESIRACCRGISQHIEPWKNLTLSNFNNIRDILVLLTISLALASFLPQWSNRDKQRYSLFKFYIRQHPDLLAYDPLKLAFAKGILNPKVY